MTETQILPAWAEDVRRRYLRGESSMFVLHGNVYDVVIHRKQLMSLTEFLTDVLLKDSKETIAVFNVATGVRFSKRASDLTGLEELLTADEKDRRLAALERLMIQTTKAAVVVEYAEVVAPAGDPSFQADADRSAIVTLHRWSFLPEIERGDNVILLISENLTELAPKIISNPKVAVVEVPMPDREVRRQAALLADPRLTEKDGERYAEITAGLKAIQITSILTPPPPSEEDAAEREAFIAGLLGPTPDAAERAHKLATLTTGMSREEIKKLLAPGAPALGEMVTPTTPATTPAERARTETYRLIARRKREILERECFGLVEFVEPQHGFEVVGGMDEVKKDLLVIAENIREGRTSRVPMGMLFTGPMGTGKTFVAEAFAKECGLTTIKLKNFRSKWVGATEGNLEKILNVIRAIGQVVVIIDEGDRAFGNTDGEGDGGTSSRVIARIKEFMSDTSNRGRILFLVMTNRPDKLDVDLKRAGRLDRKIPFLYSQTPEEVEMVARAQVRKNKIKTSVDFTEIREGFSSKLVGYSNADVEAVILLANDDAAREAGGEAEVTAAHFLRAATDYFPSRDAELLEYMELLAVFESSSRRLLPAKYATMTPEELDARMRLLRAIVGNRR
ncbi:MAG TPA: AAA family ATPase [Pyrinomonadaceae bacterium]|jgi:SpoVK/Ycf46/Vps4 family AAA+-type ATPase|nr:AAA family ATPase [Pyrinomonadaceae bacterium]